MDTAKVELAGQRYAEAEDALDAAAEDLRAETAAALARGGEVEEVAAAAGLAPTELRQL